MRVIVSGEHHRQDARKKYDRVSRLIVGSGRDLLGYRRKWTALRRAISNIIVDSSNPKKPKSKNQSKNIIRFKEAWATLDGHTCTKISLTKPLTSCPQLHFSNPVIKMKGRKTILKIISLRFQKPWHSIFRNNFSNLLRKKGRIVGVVGGELNWYQNHFM